jgi:hypothetical protein
MRQLMGEQRSIRTGLLIAEYDVTTDSIGASADQAGRSGRLRVGMDTDLREIIPEARLEIGARRRIERFPRRTERLMHTAGRFPDGGQRSSLLYLKLLLLLASIAFAADLRRRGGGCNPWHGHAHHLIRDAVRLVFERIIHLPNSELRLYGAWEWRCSERG